MTLRFTRPLEQMRPVLFDPTATGPDPVYQVFTNLDNSWINLTILQPGTYNGEYSKTFGHYHADGKDEVYRIEEGEGILLMQTENEVLVIKAQTGDKVLIPHQYGHCWINLGKDPLVSYDDHLMPQDDYEDIKKMHGMSYYIINDNGQPKAVENPNYPNHPEPKWLTAKEYLSLRET